MSELKLVPPDGPRLQGATKMSRRERAQACWLALRMGWELNPRRWSYCSDSDQVLVEYQPGGTCTWSKVRFEADETLALIEERFGAETRRHVEALL